MNDLVNANQAQLPETLSDVWTVRTDRLVFCYMCEGER